MFKNVLLIISAIALCHVSPTYAVTDTGQVEVVLRQNPVFSKLHFNDAILFFDTIKTIPNTGRPKYYPPRPLPANIVDLPVRILQNQISSYLTLDDLKSLIQAVNAIEKTLAPLAYARYIIEGQPVPEEIKNVLNRVQQTKDKQVLKDTIAHLILLESNNIFKRKKPIPPFLMPYFKSMNSNIKFLVPKYILTGAKRYIKSSGNYWIDINASNKAINALIKKNITAEMDGYISFNQAIKRKNEGLDVPKRIVATAREIRRKENFPKLHTLFNDHPEYELVVDFENAAKTTSLVSRHLPCSVKK